MHVYVCLQIQKVKFSPRWPWTEPAPTCDCRPRWTGCCMSGTCPTRSHPRKCEYMQFDSNTINIYISWPGTTYSASTGPYGRSEWATHPRPGARHLWCTRISSTPRTPATICLGLMCVTGQWQHLSPWIRPVLYKSIARYLVVLYYQANKAFEKMDAQKKEADLQKMKEKYNLNTPGRV